MQSRREAARAGQESVWDYPRPPRVESSNRRIRVRFGGRTIADTTRAVRVLETSHPPTWYLPIEDVAEGVLVPARRRTFCEFKGAAAYFDVVVGNARAQGAAWTYPEPAPGYAVLRGRVAFYPGRMEACYVDDERVRAQEGDFYGGWVTSEVAGPFKGGAGTAGW